MKKKVKYGVVSGGFRSEEPAIQEVVPEPSMAELYRCAHCRKLCGTRAVPDSGLPDMLRDALRKSALRPCPGCRGRKAELSGLSRSWKVECPCGIRTRSCEDPDEAARIWNGEPKGGSR